MERDADSFSPGGDKYLSARAFETFPYLFGERGEFAVGLYQYLRWVDDIIDEGLMGYPEKSQFLQRQMLLIRGELPKDANEMERHFTQLPWRAVPQDQVRTQINVLLHAIGEDLQNSHQLTPKSQREIRHSNWRTVHPCITGISLILNGQDIKATTDFMMFINTFNTIAALSDLEEDTSRGHFNLPLNLDEIQRILALPKEKRSQAYRAVISEERFDQEKSMVFGEFFRHIPSVWKVNMPTWQKLIVICYAYEVYFKRRILIKYLYTSQAPRVSELLSHQN